MATFDEKTIFNRSESNEESIETNTLEEINNELE